MCCRPSAEIGDKALVLGVRDCTVVGGGTSLLKTQSTPVREFSGMCSGFPIHDPRSVLPSTGEFEDGCKCGRKAAPFVLPPAPWQLLNVLVFTLGKKELAVTASRPGDHSVSDSGFHGDLTTIAMPLRGQIFAVPTCSSAIA